jgi:hypothetical protein
MVVAVEGFEERLVWQQDLRRFERMDLPPIVASHLLLGRYKEKAGKTVTGW